ncbi:MAG: sedoheptulose 7-phosphate cyclase [Planctomycetota bacterium]
MTALTTDLSIVLSCLPALPQSSWDEIDDKTHFHKVLIDDVCLLKFVGTVIRIDPHDPCWMRQARHRPQLLPHIRVLASSLGLRWGQFVGHVAALAELDQHKDAATWGHYAQWAQQSPIAAIKTGDVLRSGALVGQYDDLERQSLRDEPHAVYPTSPYRRSSGHTISSDDFTTVEATMTSSIHTSIRVSEGTLDPKNSLLADQYRPLGRCICVVDDKVDRHFGWSLEHYFAEHGIEFEKIVHRAMEADKGIPTVEKMLGEFKQLGVSRNEPVLVVGGGVLTDTAGLACSLYHRGTPYIMLSTSVVAGIDAGPSPRTCCDGFGYKNLFGAYHPPVLSITDRTFFKTLHLGWVRHGIAEIIKMAVVKDAKLFESLEEAGQDLIATRFGTRRGCSDRMNELSTGILGRAIKSYVEAEYGNLYETHQCRPHAFGHTWSPGFEIPAGLLHGHAVAIGMGWGAFVSHKQGWIPQTDRDRIFRLIESFGLSLYHDALTDEELLWAAQVKMVEKRGGHLAAPLPMDQIGHCGYLRSLSQRELRTLLRDYRAICHQRIRRGVGIDPHCHDVGLEDPSTVGMSLAASG